MSKTTPPEPAFVLSPASPPLRNELALPEADPRFGDELAREVRASAQQRLDALERVHRELVAEAARVVGQARRDLALHAIRLNGTKLRGRTYHLYEAPSGERFFSLLGPEEYARIDGGFCFQATYFLNHDGSFKRQDDDDERDRLKYGLSERGPV